MARASVRSRRSCHASQRKWLDATQGMDSYLRAMDDFSREVGRLSRKFRHAEGWRRHSHLGFNPDDFDPLRDALGAKYLVNAKALARWAVVLAVSPGFLPNRSPKPMVRT